MRRAETLHEGLPATAAPSVRASSPITAPPAVLAAGLTTGTAATLEKRLPIARPRLVPLAAIPHTARFPTRPTTCQRTMHISVPCSAWLHTSSRRSAATPAPLLVRPPLRALAPMLIMIWMYPPSRSSRCLRWTSRLIVPALSNILSGHMTPLPAWTWTS